MKGHGILAFTVVVVSSLLAEAPAQDEVKVTARWKHLGENVITLYSNGKINDPSGDHTWSKAGNTLTLRWKDAKAPGGFWVDTCTISPDGQSFKGTNQLRRPITGTLVKDPPAAKPAAPNPVPPGPKAGVARAPDANNATEYQRFADLASMETHGGVMHFDRSAPWRAKKLRASGLTDPVLRKEVEEFAKIAVMYEAAVQMRNKSNWTPQDYRDLEEDLDLRNDKDVDVYLLRGFNATFDKVKLLEKATKLALDARIRHSRMWGRIFPALTPAGGPEKTDFPLRFGAMWVRNVSGKVQTNLTIAIKTNASADLPADARLHVVYFDRLEADEWTTLPALLIGKLWDARANAYKPGANCFTCSVWSDQAHFEDVPFDLKAIPAKGPAENAYRVGCFPSAGFAGTYDATTPWTVPPRSERLRGLVDGTWVGQDTGTKKAVLLKIMHGNGSRFYALSGAREPGTPWVFEGTIRDGKVEWEPVVASKGDPDGPSYWGTVEGERMELNYGKNRTKEGTISLTFKKPKPMVVSIDAKTEADARKLAAARNPGHKIVSVEVRPDYTPYGKRFHITMEQN